MNVTALTSRGASRWMEFSDPAPWDGRYPRGAPGRCFINAYRLTRCYSELWYVEGLARFDCFDVIDDILGAGLPRRKPHAWCVTEHGEVIDRTWEEGKGFAYEGIIFSRRLINRIALETGFYITAIDWLVEQHDAELKS